MTFLASIFGLSDEQAMWRVQMHDDNEAFAHLLGRWEQPIQRLCLRMLGDAHKARDVTQEAFARVYTRRKDYRHGGKFSTFLWRVAINLCLDEIRRTRRRRELSVEQGGEGDSTPAGSWAGFTSPDQAPDATMIAREQASLVRQAVQQLPEHYRCVVILRHYENLKFREIAEALDLPEGTIKSRMSEALTLLNQLLKRAVNSSNSKASAPAGPPPVSIRGPRARQKESFVL